MKIRFFVFLALAGLVLGGCAAVDNHLENGTILAVIDDHITRTSVSDSGIFTWTEGDQVWLQTTSGSVVGTLSAGAGSASATFSYGTIIGGQLTGKSVYPYNYEHAINASVLNVVMPSSYELGAVLSNTNAVMYGVSLNGTLKFNHLAGVMRFAFRNVPEGVDKFTLTLDKKINGTFESDLTVNYPIVETVNTDVASEKTTSLYFDPLTSMSDIKLYVPVPVGTYDTLELTLYAGEQQVWAYSNTVTNTIARKTLKLMPVVTLGGNINGDIEGDGGFGDDTTDSVDGNLDMDILVGLRYELENNASLLEDHLAVVNDRLIDLQADRDSDSQVLEDKLQYFHHLQEESNTHIEMMRVWLNNEYSVLCATLHDLNSSINVSYSFLQSISEQYNSFMFKLERYKESGESGGNITEIETRLQELAVNIQESRSEIVSLTSLIDRLGVEIAKLCENPFTRSSSGTNISNAKRQELAVPTKGSGDSELQNLEDNVARISAELEALMADLDDYAASAVAIESRIQIDEGKKLDLKAVYDQYQAQIEDIEAELPELQQTVQIKNQLIEGINQKYLYYQDFFDSLSYQLLIYKVDVLELHYLINDGSHTDEEMLSLVQNYNKLKNDMEAKLEEIKAAIEVLSNV